MGLMAVAPSLGLSFSYSQDFQGSVGAEWSSTSVASAPTDSSRKYLGEFGPGTVSLTLGGLAAGESVTISFDLMVLQSWDGSSGSYGPDYFSLTANGSTLLDATFSNVGASQSYSPGNPIGGPDVAGYTGADEVNSLGYGFYGDSVYKFGGSTNAAFTFTPATSTLVLAFTGSAMQGWSDEGWGLDNVHVDQPVPEPATLAALGLGLAFLRRRRS